jgi:two-component system response regulator (stage 0 sporulation protein F)
MESKEEVTKPRVLIVDDEVNICDLLADFFGEYYEIQVANNSEDAEKHLAGQSPDLVLLDVVLGEEDGITYLKKIRARDPNLKVILVTALIDDRIREEAIAAGALDTFLKPIELVAFRDALEKVLRNGGKTNGHH